MIRDKQNIDKLFEEGLKGFKEKPPVYAWDRMDKSLDRAQFKKSLVFLRWMAASMLILLAFGAGYYFALYNLNTPNVANDIKSPILDQQNIESADPATVNNTQSKIAEINPTQENQITKTNQLDIESPLLTDDELIATNDYYSGNENSQSPDAENFTASISSNPDNSIETVKTMQLISIANIPVEEQSVISPQSTDKQFYANNKEMAVTNPAPMSLYYYPEDYNLKPSKKELETKWALGAQFAPVVSYRDISTNDMDMQASIFAKDESQHNNTENALLSYAGGIDVNYNVSKRWSIQSGLYFSRIGQENNDALNFKHNNSQYQLVSINTSTGNASLTFEKVPENIREGALTKDTINPINNENIKIIQNFDLFEIPVMVKYKVLNKRFGINLSGGLSPAYLVESHTYLETENTKHDIGNSENLNPMIINTTLALGLNYGITKKLTINFEPTFKYSLNPINRNSGFDYHPYYFSWYTGIRYNF